MPRAVLFDFDGTLADSYPAITASVNHARAHYGLPPLAESDVRGFVGRGIDHLLTNTVPGGDWQADVKRYRSYYAANMGQGTALLPGAADVLAALHAAGRKLAVCSNKPSPFTHDLLEMLGIGRYLSAVLGPEDVGHPKPAPDMLWAALDRLGVPAAKALYVGDMTVDIAAARAAGVTVWVVPTGSDSVEVLRAAGPDRLLTNLAEVGRLLLTPSPD